MHTKGVGGLRQAAVALCEHAQDEPLLELADRIVELDAAVDHLFHQTLEPVADHDQSSSRPVSRRSASRYLSRVIATTSSGSSGTGGCLFQRINSR